MVGMWRQRNKCENLWMAFSNLHIKIGLDIVISATTFATVLFYQVCDGLPARYYVQVRSNLVAHYS